MESLIILAVIVALMIIPRLYFEFGRKLIPDKEREERSRRQMEDLMRRDTIEKIVREDAESRAKWGTVFGEPLAQCAEQIRRDAQEVQRKSQEIDDHAGKLMMIPSEDRAPGIRALRRTNKRISDLLKSAEESYELVKEHFDDALESIASVEAAEYPKMHAQLREEYNDACNALESIRELSINATSTISDLEFASPDATG